MTLTINMPGSREIGVGADSVLMFGYGMQFSLSVDALFSQVIGSAVCFCRRIAEHFKAYSY
jgi:hypothetical protein